MYQSVLPEPGTEPWVPPRGATLCFTGVAPLVGTHGSVPGSGNTDLYISTPQLPGNSIPASVPFQGTFAKLDQRAPSGGYVYAINRRALPGRERRRSHRVVVLRLGE